MNLSDAQSLLKTKLDKLSINEDKGHLDHPEDLIFLGGSAGATRALQSTIASLDQDQSPGQLKDALDKIELHYSNWKDAVKKAGKATVSGQPSGSNEIDFNSLPKRK